jgi:hypothetical protein
MKIELRAHTDSRITADFNQNQKEEQKFQLIITSVVSRNLEFKWYGRNNAEMAGCVDGG